MSVQELLDYYCPMCWERELPYGECLCGLQWNAQRRKMPHYAVMATSSHAERQRHKCARKYKRTAFRVKHKDRFVLVEPAKPGSRTGPVRQTKKFETDVELLEYCEKFGIEVLKDGAEYLKMPEPFRAFALFDRVKNHED